jgi:hypothetical protein
MVDSNKSVLDCASLTWAVHVPCMALSMAQQIHHSLNVQVGLSSHGQIGLLRNALSQPLALDPDGHGQQKLACGLG